MLIHICSYPLLDIYLLAHGATNDRVCIPALMAIRYDGEGLEEEISKQAPAGGFDSTAVLEVKPSL